MADLGLADAVDAPKALLQPVGVPGQVVVDHQVRPLQVDALGGGIGRQQEGDVGVVAETVLGGAAFLSRDAAVDVHHQVAAPEERRDPLLEVSQRVAVLGEDDQLPPDALLVDHADRTGKPTPASAGGSL